LYGYEPLKFEGVIKNLERRYKETTSDSARKDIESYMTKKTCPDCCGARLNKDSLSVYVCSKNISEISAWPISTCYKFFVELINPDTTKLSSRDYEVSKMIVKEITLIILHWLVLLILFQVGKLSVYVLQLKLVQV
jgi:excinuclease ABC subunit A